MELWEHLSAWAVPTLTVLCIPPRMSMHSMLSIPIMSNSQTCQTALDLTDMIWYYIMLYIIYIIVYVFCSSAAIATSHLHYEYILMSCAAHLEKEKCLIIYAPPRREYFSKKHISHPYEFLAR